MTWVEPDTDMKIATITYEMGRLAHKLYWLDIRIKTRVELIDQMQQVPCLENLEARQKLAGKINRLQDRRRALVQQLEELDAGRRELRQALAAQNNWRRGP